MSYESQMLEELSMPSRDEVEDALLKILFKHNGIIKEFGSGEEIVNEMAGEFRLGNQQRTAYLETIYRKENRVKRAYLWHRLLFRAADSLAKQRLVSRPTATLNLTNKKEWMLTEAGYDKALELLSIPISRKFVLPVKSFEVEKIVKKLIDAPRPQDYNPFDATKKPSITTRQYLLRARGFRQAVIEAYNYTCAFCGMKIQSPDKSCWEVEAAHIVPHNIKGKDDLWNGMALCHLHHWAFDAGWFSVTDDFNIITSEQINLIPQGYGEISRKSFLQPVNENLRIILPDNKEMYPHHDSLSWHRVNRFHP